MKLSQSFAKRLSLYIFTIAGIIFIVTIMVVGGFSRSILTKEAESKVANLLEAAIGDIENVLSNVEAATLNSVWIVKENRMDPEYIKNIPSHLVRDNDYVVGSTVAFIPNYYPSKGLYYAPYSYIDENTGEQRLIQLGNANNDYPTQDWFQIPYMLKKHGGASLTMTKAEASR